MFFSYDSLTLHDFHRYRTYPYSTDFKLSFRPSKLVNRHGSLVKKVGEYGSLDLKVGDTYGSFDLKVGKYRSLDLKLTDFTHTRYIAKGVRATHRKYRRGRGGGGVAHSLTGQSQPQHPLSVLLYKDPVTREQRCTVPKWNSWSSI